MVFNLSDKFKNPIQEENSFVDDFIENAHVRLLGCGVFSTESYSVRNFMFPDFLIVHYRAGTVRIRHGDKTTILKPDSLYVFKPYEVYSGTHLDHSPVTFTYLQFEVSPYIQSYNLMKTALSLDEDRFSENPYKRIGIVLEDLVNSSRMVGRKAMLGQLAKWTAIRIISDSLDSAGGQNLLKGSSESRLINQTFRYCADHIDAPIVIGEIAQNVGTSRTSLERAFKGAFDLSPQQALLHFKIERSFEKLQQNMPLKKVAKELGFSSEYHFSNTFK